LTEAARTLELTDPRALRALAHPVRLSLVGALRRDGPLTATRAGELIGESATTCSFHLRQLAKYGFVEEAGGGRGRERPWRATGTFTSWPSVAPTGELAAAADALTQLVAERYLEQVLRWLERRPDEPEEWREAAQLGDTIAWVTAAELEEVSGRVRELLAPFVERQVDPSLRPEGARLVNYLHLAFPADRPRRG